MLDSRIAGSGAVLNPQTFVKLANCGKLSPCQKRNLRIVKSAGGVPLVGVCEYCNQTFTAAAHPLGEASKTDVDVRDQFEAHKCKRQDASQAAARIVREATKD